MGNWHAVIINRFYWGEIPCLQKNTVTCYWSLYLLAQLPVSLMPSLIRINCFLFTFNSVLGGKWNLRMKWLILFVLILFVLYTIKIIQYFINTAHFNQQFKMTRHLKQKYSILQKHIPSIIVIFQGNIIISFFYDEILIRLCGLYHRKVRVSESQGRCSKFFVVVVRYMPPRFPKKGLRNWFLGLKLGSQEQIFAKIDVSGSEIQPKLAKIVLENANFFKK